MWWHPGTFGYLVIIGEKSCFCSDFQVRKFAFLCFNGNQIFWIEYIKLRMFKIIILSWIGADKISKYHSWKTTFVPLLEHCALVHSTHSVLTGRSTDKLLCVHIKSASNRVSFRFEFQTEHYSKSLLYSSELNIYIQNCI